ncbi:MAG: hypothetical protein HYX47_11405 [Burkholderiales bacterium]|nr:hypothetical protein [Burkholderiales bacterium]
MDWINAHAAAARPATRCYRLTPRGRACVDTGRPDTLSGDTLSRYLHDVMVLCGSGAWFEQLLQFMPRNSLEESLRSLLDQGLIETVQPGEAPQYVPPPARRPLVGFLRRP